MVGHRGVIGAVRGVITIRMRVITKAWIRIVRVRVKIGIARVRVRIHTCAPHHTRANMNANTIRTLCPIARKG